MNFGAALGVLSTVLADAPAGITFIMSSVSAVENTALSGTDKMTAVLNAAEAFLQNAYPTLAATWAPIMKAIEDFVNELVTLWNDMAVFTHLPAIA